MLSYLTKQNIVKLAKINHSIFNTHTHSRMHAPGTPDGF